jgi:nucleoside diphosphate kinase
MSGVKNFAFVFIKPHANNAKVQQYVADSLRARGITIHEEGDFTGPQIDEGKLIDQHYYAIASKATLLKPEQIPVPSDKFHSTFGISWEEALNQGRVFNALDACKELNVDAAGLDKLWATAKKVKFGGGFYCGEIHREGHPTLFTFNAFFMEMRDKFVNPSVTIHYYVVEFDAELLSWSDFRGKVLGPTDPAAAPSDSLRGSLYAAWEEYGLSEQPNTGDNCVHASASPFEGLAERMNWLKKDPETDPFGSAAIAAGIPVETLRAWSVDPQVKGKSVFDQLEDTNADECLEKMVALNA